MKPLLRLGLPLLAVLSGFGRANPAWALNLVRSVGLTQARSGVPLTVWDGGGTNIDFTHTHEIIQKVWLDDASQLTLDVDGTLCSGGTCNGSATGAGIIHLRRLLGVHFPNLPSSPSTLLSVVTESPQGIHNLYQFQISYAHGTPQYTTLSMVRASDPSENVDLEAVNRGLQQAIACHLITANSPVIARMHDFISSVNGGASMEEAIAHAQVSLALVSRLAEMGRPALLPNLVSNPDSLTSIAPSP
ncbi:MAG TPA: hypothetical protein V6C88_03500 [Chroococcidiopsis sp.]